jgi:hypothetical protein
MQEELLIVDQLAVEEVVGVVQEEGLLKVGESELLEVVEEEIVGLMGKEEQQHQLVVGGEVGLLEVVVAEVGLLEVGESELLEVVEEEMVKLMVVK